MFHMTSTPVGDARLSGKGGRRPPGPAWHTFAQNTRRLMQDGPGFLLEMRERYGDVVRVPILLGSFTAVFHPDGVRHLLQENHLNYGRDVPDYHVLRPVLGNGLVTSDGKLWRRQRRLMQPAFHRQRLLALADLMTTTTLERMAQWETAGFLGTGRPLALTQEMTALTLRIVGKALFGIDLSAEVARIGQALTTLNHVLSEALYQPWLLFLPTPHRHRLNVARCALSTVVEQMIGARRSIPDHDDLLALLLQAQDEETGEGMTDEQVRDEVMTLLLTGLEPIANTLSWTFFLLSKHPEMQGHLRKEYQEVLKGRPPTVEDLTQLPLTRMVIEEALRLYPSSWGFSRRAHEEDTIGGYRIPRGSFVLVSAYVTHHHPALWERPDAFDPERFSAERSATRPRFAFFPFGGGPHQCIGNQFALIEAQLILATILSHYHVQLLSATVVAPDPLLTLRPREEIWVTVNSTQI
ncbi:cytochrome P450 [Ktedonosporobacter rubrisoli]|nr:cytochrome P450 [Ktedonosporobacter rubrisoli]